MKSNIMPKTKLGKWSVGLNAVFLVVTVVSILLVLVFGVLSFEDHWWDVTIFILVLLCISAFVTAIIAVIRNKERCVLVYLSIALSACAILFLIFHSLFIND